MADVICIGDLLIDFVPTVTGTGLVDAPAFAKAPGGSAANVAVGLSRLGASSGFMGKVGDDPFGHFLAATLVENGVETSALRYESRARTALAFVSLRADGEREFLFYRDPSADSLFAPEDVDLPSVEAARILHFDSISLASKLPRLASLFAVDHAIARGLIISYDVNLRLALWADDRAAKAGIGEGLRRSQIVKISDDELEFMTGERDPRAMRRELWHDAMRLAVVTTGGSGSTIVLKDTIVQVPSFPVKPVDTTGAGDGFMAGLLGGIVKTPQALEEPDRLAEICRVANAVGALTTTKRGAIPALPTRREVEAFMKAPAATRPSTNEETA